MQTGGMIHRCIACRPNVAMTALLNCCCWVLGQSFRYAILGQSFRYATLNSIDESKLQKEDLRHPDWFITEMECMIMHVIQDHPRPYLCLPAQLRHQCSA